MSVETIVIISRLAARAGQYPRVHRIWERIPNIRIKPNKGTLKIDEPSSSDTLSSWSSVKLKIKVITPVELLEPQPVQSVLDWSRYPYQGLYMSGHNHRRDQCPLARGRTSWMTVEEGARLGRWKTS